jgi:hypothetical protein
VADRLRPSREARHEPGDLADIEKVAFDIEVADVERAAE